MNFRMNDLYQSIELNIELILRCLQSIQLLLKEKWKHMECYKSTVFWNSINRTSFTIQKIACN